MPGDDYSAGGHTITCCLASYTAGENALVKKYSSECFVVIFSAFVSSMPSKVIVIVIEFIFWAFLRAHFNPRLTARAKTSLSRAQNIFMPANRYLYCFILRGRVGYEMIYNQRGT